LPNLFHIIWGLVQQPVAQLPIRVYFVYAHF